MPIIGKISWKRNCLKYDDPDKKTTLLYTFRQLTMGITKHISGDHLWIRSAEKKLGHRLFTLMSVDKMVFPIEVVVKGYQPTGFSTPGYMVVPVDRSLMSLGVLHWDFLETELFKEPDPDYFEGLFEI